MTNVTPIQETVEGALRNALQIAQIWGSKFDGSLTPPERSARDTFAGIARLLAVALEGLGEPNLSAMQAGEILLREWSGTPEPQRQLRDTIQGILTAQITGIVPETWVKTWGKL